ncbi:hypothetical protein SNE40_014576 [Patella caerulea]|uniref:Homeobox domain-containing protein n=1 Tax=Patella caerulea TaxID=87958 RepID=A0AAN8PJC0_PATCE
MKPQDLSPFTSGCNGKSDSLNCHFKTGGIRKRYRTHFTSKQVEKLEEIYRQTSNPYRELIIQLSSVLNLTDKNISIWFKNRRAKTKRQEKASVKNKGVVTLATMEETRVNISSNHLYPPNNPRNRLVERVALTQISSENISDYSSDQYSGLSPRETSVSENKWAYNYNHELPAFSNDPYYVRNTDPCYSYQQNNQGINGNIHYQTFYDTYCKHLNTEVENNIFQNTTCKPDERNTENGRWSTHFYNGHLASFPSH